MPIIKCRDCGTIVGKDKKSGKYWCPNCREVKDGFVNKYKIAILGKNTGSSIGDNNFIKCIARYLKKEGHEIIEISIDNLYEVLQPYDIEECFRYKKKIPLKFIEYKYNPDFIYVEQTYNRYDISDIKCPVIYQHREYTHFPDIDTPDMLLCSYPFRLETFESGRPHEYSKIKYRDDLLVAVDQELFPPSNDKIIYGISFLGWAVDFWQFAVANGKIVKMIVEDQVGFMEECKDKGYIRFIQCGKGHDYYRDILSKCEAILIDDGYMNGFGRTLLEAMASKTLCIIRIHNKEQEDFYKKIGLTNEMCYFIDDVAQVGLLKEGWFSEYNIEERKKKIEKAYEWIIENHTYETRSRQLIEKFEEFKNGIEKKPYFMGYAKHRNLKVNDNGEAYIA